MSKLVLNDSENYTKVNFEEGISNIKVSIIVPVYNVERYLRICLDSIISQNLKEIEIICINDGSTDSSLNILMEYANCDKRVKVVDKCNEGYGKTMNLGLELASGEYIGIVESDDFILPNMYEDLYMKAVENDIDFIKADFQRFIGDGPDRKLFYNKAVKDNTYYNRLIYPLEDTSCMSGMINIWTGIYSRSFLKNHRIHFNETKGASFQDNGFYFQTFAYAKKVLFINKAYYMNRRDNPNSSVYCNNKIWSMKDEYDFIERELKKDEHIWNALKNQFIYRKFLNYRFTYLKLDDSNKKIFLDVFHSEYLDYYNSGLFDFSIFENEDYEEINLLLEDSNEYYKATIDETVHVTVIVPVYNEEKYISFCLESVLTQTLKGLEIICVDDGSTDRSVEIINEYIKQDSRIKLLIQNNSGAGAARNNALNCAKGEYVCFLDGDDYYPNSSVLRNLYLAAVRNKVDICGGSFSRLINGKESTNFPEKYKKYVFDKNEMHAFEDYQFDYGYHRFVYNRNMLLENDIKFPLYRRYQDPIFMLLAMEKSFHFYSIKQVVYCYRKDDNTIEWTKEKALDLLRAFKMEMDIALRNKYEVLYCDSVTRLNNDYNNIFELFNEKEDFCILKELVDIQDSLDVGVLKRHKDIGNDFFMLKPLYRMTYGAIKEKNKKENKKSTVIKSDKSLSELYLHEKDLNERNQNQIINLLKDNSRLQMELLETRMSLSCRIGLAVTFIPRQIRRLFSAHR